MASARERSLKLMNLLDTSTYAFVSDTTLERINRCAILSHRWQDDEVDMQKYKKFRRSQGLVVNDQTIHQAFVDGDDGRVMDRFSQHTTDLDESEKKGIAKILKFCWIARRDGYPYAWIDTCCVDKSDPRALDKALNSMFDYYKEAAVCYVYLNDVAVDRSESIRGSGWFKRGWTLQEMLAAKDLTFVDAKWRRIGSKAEKMEDIVKASGIERRYLRRDGYKDACVAVRMSWLSRRETRYDEDMAYCVIGILGVTVQIQYGQGGEEAFRRLQEAVVKTSPEDESLFAWLGSPDGLTATGLLAPWPTHFARCGDLEIIRPGRKGLALRQRVNQDADSIDVSIPTALPNAQHGRHWNHGLAAKKEVHKLSLNCRTTDTEANDEKSYVILTLIQNNSGEWRRVPINNFEVGHAPKSRRGTMTWIVPHSSMSDQAKQLDKVRRRKFQKIRAVIRGAIDSEKEL